MSYRSQYQYRNQWIVLLAVLLFSCYVIVISEWLFFSTKPSFTNIWSPAEHLSTLLLAPLPLISVGLIFLVPAFALVWLLPNASVTEIVLKVSTLVPAIILSLFIFLLVENFTYTVMNFNIGDFIGWERYIYAIALVLCVFYLSRNIWNWNKEVVKADSYHFYILISVVLLVVSILVGLSLYSFQQLSISDQVTSRDDNRQLPNILILSSDGLNSRKMSVYGYERATTPFIESLKSESLVVENHFSNNAKSTGSIGALFSGKLPTKTRVIYPPDIFRGVHTHQHIPAILKKIGYRNADISIRHYTDPFDLNLQDGFDYANGRTIESSSNSIRLPNSLVRVFSSESYFLENSYSRIRSRILHALSLEDMINPYELVSDKEDALRYFPDERRMEQLFEFIEESQTPFFAHVHLMGTHGPKFNPDIRRFSIGKEQDASWMTDFYDDAMLTFDDLVESTVSWLKEKNLYEETLLIITSDHGAYWMAVERIPLILRFPNQQFAGVRSNNVQRVDVSATILNYLGVTVPTWVDGESFLHQELDPKRPIFYVDSVEWGAMNEGGWRNTETYKEPYYSLGGVGMIVAQNWYFLDPLKNRLLSGTVKDYADPSSEDELPTADEARQSLTNHLIENDYPVPDSQLN